ncbi:alpha/beta hydrolase [Sneathiella limimaris]|uniref:alpha/beta hydrolase n=1 Tax=Sneathiella limimaris TaxID=1964213 RepID=UPI00146A3E19|nr:alpha/beta hydrolase [Sneathiella limimaris]
MQTDIQSPPEVAVEPFPTLIDRSETSKQPRKSKKPGFGILVFLALNRLASSTSTGWGSKRLQKIFETPQRHSIPQKEQQWLKSAKQDWFDHEGHRAAVYTFGQGHKKALLVHGLSGRAGQLSAFADPLLEEGYQVIALDLPAHGNAPGKRISMPAIARLLAAFQKSYGDIDTLIAHSNGAAATTLALSFGMQIEKVIYLAPPEDLKGYLYRLSKLIGFNAKVTRHAEAQLATRYGLPFDAVRGSTLSKNYKLPALIFHDLKDKMVPFEEGERLAKSWQDAVFVRTGGLGHNRILQEPEVIAISREFLRRNSS